MSEIKPLTNVYIILGPTSSGKTSLALKLASDFNGEVLSADSRQLYKYMDIGTGKLPINDDIKFEKKDKHWVMNNIKVWGYDLVSPNSFYSGYDFALFALNKVREIRSSGKNVFIVGGTGFYIDLITQRVTPSTVEPDFKLREELKKMSVPELNKKLMSLNISDIKNLDIHNPMRIIRAIENHLGNKKNLNSLPYLTDVSFNFIGLKSTNDYLYKRADLWVDAVWKNGLLGEVNTLINMGFEHSPKLGGLVYKSVVDYIRSKDTKNQVSSEETVQLIKYDLHAYIRRQLTYLKRNNKIQWFDISTGDYIKNIYNLVNG